MPGKDTSIKLGIQHSGVTCMQLDDGGKAEPTLRNIFTQVFTQVTPPLTDLAYQLKGIKGETFLLRDDMHKFRE